MNNTNIVSQAIIKLFDDEMFYAEIIMQMKRILSTQVPVAGVCIKDNIELHLNLEAFAQYPLAERVGILKHECEHILRDHIPRFKEMCPEVFEKEQDIATTAVNNQKFMYMNVAADCAINSHVKDIPKAGMFPEKFNLERNQTAEWYLERLKDNKKMKEMMQSKKGKGKPGEGKSGPGSPGQGSEDDFGDHDIWKDSEGAKEIIKEKIKQAVNKAAEKTRGAGRMTAENELLVSGLNKSTVCWKAQIRRFVAKTIETTLESSRKKRNRRYGIAIPGEVKIEELHIGVAVDTSGSMMHALEQCMAEMGEIAKYAKVTVIEVDTEIKNSYLYDKRKQYKQLKGGGGTAYQPAFDYFNKEKKNPIDALIYIGDMDMYDREALKKPKYPVLWAVIGDQKPPADFGSVVKVEVKNG